MLSIDEFKGNAGGEKFQAILTDAKNHKLVDILPSRTQATLVDYIHSFKNRNDVRYFVMDMNTVYRDIARNYFPNATIVIDKFHYKMSRPNVQKILYKNVQLVCLF